MKVSQAGALAMLSITALVAGCGGGSNKDDVKSAWQQAATAMAKGDGNAACSHFSPAVSQTLVSSSGSSCADAVKQLAAPLSAADRSSVGSAKISSVQVNGDRATITYQLTSGLKTLGFAGTSRLVKTNGKWLIAPRTG